MPKEIQALNAQFRGQDKPTNVLSFPYEPILGENETPLPLGDIAICAPLVEQEAKDQNIPLLMHWAHLVIHGSLHLLGYDHQTDEQAVQMESLETQMMIELGFSDPYGDTHL